MKKTVIISSIILVLIVILGLEISYLVLKPKGNNNNPTINLDEYVFKLDNNMKYEITTDLKYYTMQNDGGSYTSQYYELDLENNIVSQKMTKYTANLGNKPDTSTKTIYTKKIKKSLSKEINKELQELISKEDIKDSTNYHSYSIKTLNNEKIIYNTKTINNIKEILTKIDND